MATEERIYTYEDLLAFPEDHVRREIIEGRLYVTTSPTVRHQRLVRDLGIQLIEYAKTHGGESFNVDIDVYLSERDVVVPDIIYVHDPSRFEKQRLVGPPDVVVEVSSPSTRRRDLQLKWSLYRQVGVSEYWFVDLDPETIEVYRLDRDYEEPTVFGTGDVLTSTELPGLEIQLADLFGS